MMSKLLGGRCLPLWYPNPKSCSKYLTEASYFQYNSTDFIGLQLDRCKALSYYLNMTERKSVVLPAYYVGEEANVQVILVLDRMSCKVGSR